MIVVYSFEYIFRKFQPFFWGVFVFLAIEARMVQIFFGLPRPKREQKTEN